MLKIGNQSMVFMTLAFHLVPSRAMPFLEELRERKQP
jgi:hypothetical protein